MSGFKYKAFISYSHADSMWAEWLLNGLESYKVPRKLVGKKTDKGLVPAKLSPIFRDRDELPAAGKLTERLFEALANSEFLLVVCSPTSAQSKLVNKEIAEFKRLHGDDHILCMIVDGTPFAQDPAQECFPQALLHHFHADGMKAGLSAEGLAADVRPEGDGRQMGLNKIIAGLVGVGLNDIVQREAQRRNRKLLAGGLATAASIVIMGGLTYNAMSARQEAEQLSNIASAKSDESERRLVDNQQLAFFLTTSIYDELLKIGSLDALERINKKVLDYYQKDGLSSLQEQHLYGFTGTQMRMGQLLDRRGDSDRAREVFESTLNISRDFYALYPESSKAIHRMQNNLWFVGYLAFRQGRTADAEAALRESVAYAKQGLGRPLPYLRRNWPPEWNAQSDAVWLSTISESELLLARVLASHLGRYEEALTLLHGTLDNYERVAEIRAGDPEALVSVGSSLHYLGATYIDVGDLDKAEEMYARRLALFEKLAQAEPNNFRFLRRVLTSKNNVGIVAFHQNNFGLALDQFSKAASGFDTLTQQDPGNTLWLADSAHTYMRLAQANFHLGNFAAAREASKRARAQIDEALARDSSRPSRLLNGHRLRLVEARLAYQAGQIAEAEEVSGQLFETLMVQKSTYFTVAGTRENLAETALFYGDLLAQNGDRDSAAKAWAKAVDMLAKSPARQSVAANRLSTVAQARLENADKALAR